MKQRWVMNRIGFINFWLYDEEEFYFANGRLLLRGQNGSGKSITTQSFIPFVLDGDRTPSRLDPFGSSDRRMEFYFLGEGEKEDSTGYLYLEFKKGEMYRTIGIGQRARRGRPMDFWGFLVLDGRRVGRELALYQQVGSTKIPLDRRDLQQALGEGGLMTTSPSEYKKLVNQHIFGFRKTEQYEQLIRLLVKVRAPKLSKEFRPSKVYEILEDSLQTLTDEDLRPMVDAMEKMDEIQESLDTLRRAFDDVRVIRTEYTRYNQYMLAKKAQAYLKQHKEAQRLQKAWETLLEREKEAQTMLEQAEQGVREKTERERLLRAERESLVDSDLQAMHEKREQAQEERREAKESGERFAQRAAAYQEKIREAQREEKAARARQALLEEEVEEALDEMEDLQETLCWEGHTRLRDALQGENADALAGMRQALAESLKHMTRCHEAIRLYEEAQKRLDEASWQCEKARKEEREAEKKRNMAEEALESAKESWITQTFTLVDGASEFKPERPLLLQAEQEIRAYHALEETLIVGRRWRDYYENKRMKLTDIKVAAEQSCKQAEEEWERLKEAYQALKDRPELEPERSEAVQATRQRLQALGVEALPFYRTIEFAPELDEKQRAVIEAQLEAAGLLDALVAPPAEREKVARQYPAWVDVFLAPEKLGETAEVPFQGLRAAEQLHPDMRREVQSILACLGSSTVWLESQGYFRQGLLHGRAEKSGQAEYVGEQSRRQKKERELAELQRQMQQQEAVYHETARKVQEVKERLRRLEEEYRQQPGTDSIVKALQMLTTCALQLEVLENNSARLQEALAQVQQEKDGKYQTMLRLCKEFPYGRTLQAYEEAQETGRAYEQLLLQQGDTLQRLLRERAMVQWEQGKREEAEMGADDALAEQHRMEMRVKTCEARIAQLEAFLNRPDIREKARRLAEVGQELARLREELEARQMEQARLQERLEAVQREKPSQEAALRQAKTLLTYLQQYFEEELALELVMPREDTVLHAAQEALKNLRGADQNRESTDMLQALYQVYQRRSGQLISYGTALEDCFEAPDAGAEGALRRRVRVVSVWNGKRVYLAEFYQLLKSAIEETEVLIQEKDRELFEDILSQTISQQLTDRIAESRKWVDDMSSLMKALDTSMGLTFSLDWKPNTSETQEELDTTELEQILMRDKDLLTMEDIEKVASHFRSKIRSEKMLLETRGDVVNYMDLVREAMDYRGWFTFQMYYRRGDEARKPLTNAAFNRFSGGEKAMAMYVPLFAAVNAQYQKAAKEDYPRIIALDEAFAGVDDKNISSMFELVHTLDFDYIMNSQALWGCYASVDALRIAELLRPLNAKVVTVIHYTWNGMERRLDEE